MRTTPIPVTVGTFEARRQHEEPKVTTVTRMATLTGLIPATVGTVEAYHGGGGGGIPLGGGGLGTQSAGPYIPYVYIYIYTYDFLQDLIKVPPIKPKTQNPNP